MEQLSEIDRSRLAALAVFRGVVDADALALLGDAANPAAIADLTGLTGDTAGALLNRAAAAGLVTPLWGSFYRVGPWAAGAPVERFVPAYTYAMGALGNHYQWEYEEGNLDVVDALAVEEPNLLYARELARDGGAWSDVMGCMQGLRTLYGEETGNGRWSELVYDLLPYLVDPASDGPLPGREAHWALITEYRVELALATGDHGAVPRLQSRLVDWNRSVAAPALVIAPEDLSRVERNQIRTLAVSLDVLGGILRDQRHPGCVNAYQEAVDLFHHIGDEAAEGSAAYNLGNAHLAVVEPHNPELAEQWYQYALELFDDDERRALVTGQLGQAAFDQFQAGRVAGRSDLEMVELVIAAINRLEQAARLTPSNPAPFVAQLGNVYSAAGRMTVAMPRYAQAIELYEKAGDRLAAGRTRFDAALALARSSRTIEALSYAQDAAADFEAVGDAVAIDDARHLIAALTP
jgi:tetratricopeptide (TPR) repeat protein